MKNLLCLQGKKRREKELKRLTEWRIDEKGEERVRDCCEDKLDLVTRIVCPHRGMCMLQARAGCLEHFRVTF